jgi:transcriptional antiterminator
MSMQKFYTTEELAEIFDVSPRTVQRQISKIADELSANKKGYKIPVNIAFEIAERNNYDFQKEIDGQLVRTEYFTENEYIEFHKRLSEYPVLKNRVEQLLNDLDYHRKSAESHNRQMELILRNLEQRNFIEAKDKKIE